MAADFNRSNKTPEIIAAAGAASGSDHGRDLVETLLAVGEGRALGLEAR